MNLTEATWTDVDRIRGETNLALLPVGATEQHGPHAPLGTDALNAEAVAERGIDVYREEYDAEAVVAPVLPVGVSEEHRQFAGTLWLSPETFRSAVRETVESLAHHGFDRVIVVNGHGGNVEALGEVTRAITRHDAAVAVPFTWFEHVHEDAPPMGHAGGRETALLRAIHPDLVHEDRIEAARAGASDRWGEWIEGINLAVDSAEFTENGVVGDPGDDEASAETGERQLDHAARSLARVADAVATRDPPDPPARGADDED